MEPPLRQAYAGRRVLLTGHTGFKGAWLAEWLLELGAEVTGFSLPSPTTPSLHAQLGLSSRIREIRGDIRDLDAWRDTVRSVRPDHVFHLAAQPLVRRSYDIPAETFAVNVQGTVHVLEGLRGLDHPCAVVCVTTDKCYENREWSYGYRENDPLGGHDPYSASKAAAELVAGSYRRSFFSQGPVRVATSRAGNVIGGGDWSADRLVPDCLRALAAGRPIEVRNPRSTRPWQHVLEPLGGYLWLGARLHADPGLAGAYNFGPGPDAHCTVARLVEEVLKSWPGDWIDASDPTAPHEAGQLQLSIDLARVRLGWLPVWRFEEAIAATVDWYRRAAGPAGSEGIGAMTLGQIRDYTRAAARAGVAWALSKNA